MVPVRECFVPQHAKQVLGALRSRMLQHCPQRIDPFTEFPPDRGRSGCPCKYSSSDVVFSGNAGPQCCGRNDLQSDGNPCLPGTVLPDAGSIGMLGRAHAGRQRFPEPPLVDGDNLAAARSLWGMRARATSANSGAVLAKHQRIVGVGEEIADHAEIRCGLLFRDHPVQLHVIIGERIGLPVTSSWNDSPWSLPNTNSIRMFCRWADYWYRSLVHGAARQHDRLAREVTEIQDPAAPPHQQLGAGDEHGRRESPGDFPWHSALLVVEPHSRSTSPEFTRSKRFSGVTGRRTTRTSLPSSCPISSTTISQGRANSPSDCGAHRGTRGGREFSR